LKTDHKRNLLLFAIFIVAFLFRVAVIFHNEYPPSSDIGFHSSIINLILDEEKLPLWNPYHMGGEPLATPPGYHLFTSLIILFTGVPLLAAQLLISAFFSSFAVFPMYLVSKKYGEATAQDFWQHFL
jgi:asparagine N-glycosylation enzyme membrane subunit Stt3